jgi:hypothetical protein
MSFRSGGILATELVKVGQDDRAGGEAEDRDREANEAEAPAEPADIAGVVAGGGMIDAHEDD